MLFNRCWWTHTQITFVHLSNTHEIQEICHSVTFYFRKYSFSENSEKCIFAGMIRGAHTSFFPIPRESCEPSVVKLNKNSFTKLNCLEFHWSETVVFLLRKFWRMSYNKYICLLPTCYPAKISYCLAYFSMLFGKEVLYWICSKYLYCNIRMVCILAVDWIKMVLFCIS